MSMIMPLPPSGTPAVHNKGPMSTQFPASGGPSAPGKHGQYESMPPKKAADHPLGPYAPRPVGRPSGEPRPDGQYAHATKEMHNPPQDNGAKTGKTSAEPKPNGQYPHADYEGSGTDGGGGY